MIILYSSRQIAAAATRQMVGSWGTTEMDIQKTYTPGSTNMAGKWGRRIESMYFLFNMGIFQPAMLVDPRW